MASKTDQPPEAVITLSSDSSDSTAETFTKPQLTTWSYRKKAVEAWIDTEAPEANTPVDDAGYAERTKADMHLHVSDPPESDFVDNISAALQVKRFADGALSELEVMLMVSEVNGGQDPYIVAAKHNATVTEMLQAVSKFAGETLRKVQCGPKTVAILVTEGRQLVVVQDGKICSDAAKTLMDIGLKPVNS